MSFLPERLQDLLADVLELVAYVALLSFLLGVMAYLGWVIILGILR